MLTKAQLDRIHTKLVCYHSALDNQLYRHYNTAREERECLELIALLEAEMDGLDGE